MKRIGRDTYIDGSLEIEGRLTSRLPDGGLSPLQVISKVLNLNVNVEFLGGYRAIEFPRKAENANITGNYTFANAPTISAPSTAPTAAARYDQITALSGSYVPLTRTLTAGPGIGAIGDLSINRTIGLDLAYTDARYGQTLTRGTGLTGSNYNGSAAQTWAVAYGTSSGTAAEGNDPRFAALSNRWNSSIVSDINSVTNGGVFAWNSSSTNVPVASTFGSGLTFFGVTSTGNTASGNWANRIMSQTNGDWFVQYGSGGASSVTWGAIYQMWTTKQFTATDIAHWNSAYSGIHSPVTIGTANGLSLSTQAISLQLASGSQNGALSSTDWNTFNSKAAALSGTSGKHAKFTSSSTIGNSLFSESGYQVTLGDADTNPKSLKFHNYNDFWRFEIANQVLTYTEPNAAILVSQGGGTAPFDQYGKLLFFGRESSSTNGGISFWTGSPRTLAFDLSATGIVTISNQLVSTLSTGTSPFAVSSTTRVENLNVQYLSMYESWQLLDRSNHTGTQAFSTITGVQSLTAGAGLSGTAYNGSNAYTWSLASGVVTPGTYQKITLDTYGRGIAGGNLNSSDIITALGYTPGSGSGTIGGGGTSGYVAVFQSGGVNIQNSRLYDSGSGRVATVSGAGFQSAGDILAGGDIDCGLYTFIGNKVATNVAEFANTLVVGGSSIGSGLAFEVRGTTKASMPFPKMTRAQRLALSPSEAHFVYQNEVVGASARGVKYYDGTAWTHMVFNAGAA